MASRLLLGHQCPLVSLYVQLFIKQSIHEAMVCLFLFCGFAIFTFIKRYYNDVKIIIVLYSPSTSRGQTPPSRSEPLESRRLPRPAKSRPLTEYPGEASKEDRTEGAQRPGEIRKRCLRELQIRTTVQVDSSRNAKEII